MSQDGCGSWDDQVVLLLGGLCNRCFWSVIAAFPCVCHTHTCRECILLSDGVRDEMAPQFHAWSLFSRWVMLSHVIINPAFEVMLSFQKQKHGCTQLPLAAANLVRAKHHACVSSSLFPLHLWANNMNI